MDINSFINQLDKLFEEKRINDVEPFLNESLSETVREGDYSARFTILNEMMGFFRDTSQYEKSIKACKDCLQLMEQMGIVGTVDYATSLQNIANAHRAAGMLKESLAFYNQAIEIYENNIEPSDYRFASINNNIALLYQEMGDYQMAVNHLEKALDIIKNIEDSEIEVATTYSNLGASLLELDRTDEAIDYLEKALEIYRKDTVKNFHYSAALSAMATAKCKQEKYEEALPLYEEALKEIELNMGKGTAYNITMDNLKQVYEKLGYVICEGDNEKSISGIELSRKFYEEYGKAMIHKYFPQYENKIAVGFVGEGSERFGFDDEYSKDHDFGPGFCMWVTEQVYDEIGKNLQEEYDKLPLTFMGVTRVNTKMAQGRVGVSVIGDFYEKYTGYRQAPDEPQQWMNIEDYKLATVTNGVVFRDDEGIFTEIRNEFVNQPESARLIKLAREIAAMAQTGQSNYPRSMARKDYVTAHICISEFMQHTMKCLFILNRKYAPYYKWMLQGTKGLDILPEVGDILRALADMEDQRSAWEGYNYESAKVNEADIKLLTIEIVAKLIINELHNQKLIEAINSNFLNDYVEMIISKASEIDNDNKSMNRDEVINEVVKLEFEAFDKVQNVGGRAECQNNWPFFYIMRKSQYMTWTDDMLLCIRDLWKEYTQIGWNFITEKYGRMMEYTSPEEYAQIKDSFPVKDEKTRNIVDQIAQIQVGWMEEFAKNYPKLSSNARDISSNADNMYNTSYETYLKGELLTYSDELLKLYAEYVIKLAREGKNLAEMTIKNTAILQGYKSLEDAEEKI